MKKRILSLLIVLCLAVGLLPAVTAAEIASGTCGENLTWLLDRQGRLTISGTGSMVNYTEGSAPWHSNRDQIHAIIIEDGVTSIGYAAFWDCYNTTSVSIPDSITDIGDAAFMYCGNLTDVSLPLGVTRIGNFAFNTCAHLAKIDIPNSVVEIGDSAFAYCKDLKAITIPNSVTTIEDSAFFGCSELTEIHFCGNAPFIGTKAFKYVKATAYYPANNPTWTSDVLKNYGGTIAWVPFSPTPFTDVPTDSFYYAPVMWAVENGITNGLTATEFGPTAACNRAQVVTFLWRAEGCPEPNATSHSFVDVQAGSFYEKAVLWAVENGITTGTDATHFSPNAVCNRATVVTFLHRAAGAPAVENANNPFSDVPANGWFTAPVLWAVEQGITNGLSATEFGPTANCNRAQVVTFLYRAYTA